MLCADAKLNFDDNAEFRQSEIFKRRDVTQENQLDVEAQKYDLNYIGLDGSVACLGVLGGAWVKLWWEEVDGNCRVWQPWDGGAHKGDRTNGRTCAQC